VKPVSHLQQNSSATTTLSHVQQWS